MIKHIFSKMRWKKPKPNPVDADVFQGDFRNSADGSVVPLRSSPIAPRKKDNAELFNEAVNKLVDQLEGINEHLDRQGSQNEQLVGRLDALPKAVDEQRQSFAKVAEQLRQKIAHDEKVADNLAGIHEKVAEAAAIDAQMCDHFEQFSGTLSKLDEDTVSQTEWIQQMSRTFSASERYIKYTLAKQQLRFYWIFGISLGISFLAITGLIIGIVLLRG
ncbi:MAG: hypothetical protein H8E62_02730 [Planctomycetes bacterium]|nr:hypothetical protein [Planctomycetota bacterium]